MNVLHAQGLSKSFGENNNRCQVLRDASFSMNAGEFVTILGPSGSGKSTLLNICGLIESCDTGALYFKQQCLTGLNAFERTEFRRQYLGFIFQSFNLVPVMTVADNVGYPLMLLGWGDSQRHARVAEVLEQVGLTEFASQRPERLSGGQCQRVAVARALVKKPALIIADEPTASLDNDTALSVVQLMKDLAREQGTACLVATHDSRLLEFSDQVLSVNHGRIEPEFTRDIAHHPVKTKGAAA